jgi:hypothetical protein
MNKDEIVDKLFFYQLKDINPNYRLNSKDIVRLASYISSDPFSETKCCKWKGAISNSSNQSKYINFWFNKKKQALHRILYMNYIGELDSNKYLRFTCKNSNMKGICCNINHLDIINKNDTIDSTIDTTIDSTVNTTIDTTNNINLELENLQTNKTKTSKNKSEKIKSNTDMKKMTINSSNNSYDEDIFVIVFDD